MVSNFLDFRSEPATAAVEDTPARFGRRRIGAERMVRGHNAGLDSPPGEDEEDEQLQEAGGGAWLLKSMVQVE